MFNCIKLPYITISLTAIMCFNQNISFTQETLNKKNNVNKIMFSSRVKQETKQLSKQILFVVKNEDCFLVKFKDGKYIYEKPEDKCYELENHLSVCTYNGRIQNIVGEHHNMYQNDYKFSENGNNDWFFKEKTNKCNEMKFDIIKNFFIEDKQITYSQYQLYILNYFDVVRLVIFNDQDYDMHNKNNNNNNNNIKNKNNLSAFTISYSNEVGCSIYDKFKIYNLKIDNKKKKKKEKQIVKKSKQTEEIKNFDQVFQGLALKNFQYLQAVNSGIIDNDTVIVLNENNVEKINIISLNINWEKTNGKKLIAPLLFYKSSKSDNKKNK